ncbi:hypothetical protein AX17_000410 [Amanita inopinata Kibby_2008]|nr:hypothetical protein AX17_000410 [Amanita inopinata Kibby_2008]
MVDSYGNEHMIMTFYVQGKPEGWIQSATELSYFERANEWAHEKYEVLSQLTLDESVAWSKEQAEAVRERLRDLFKYLSGTVRPVVSSVPTIPSESPETQKKEESSAWSFAGMFSSLKGSKRAAGEVVKSRGQTFTEGEVHADFIRNDQGYFVFRYLLIDMPSSRHPNPVRIFIERVSGVRENEPVMRWNSYS